MLFADPQDEKAPPPIFVIGRSYPSRFAFDGITIVSLSETAVTVKTSLLYFARFTTAPETAFFSSDSILPLVASCA